MIDAKRTKEPRVALGGALKLASLDGREVEVGNVIDLLAILDDYSALKAENERLRRECLAHFRGKDGMGTCDPGCQWYPGEKNTCPMSRDGILSDLHKAEAENDGWTEVLEDAANKHLRNLDKIARLEAQLAKQAPLIEAVTRADVTNLLDDARSPVWADTEAILRAALVLRDELNAV